MQRAWEFPLGTLAGVGVAFGALYTGAFEAAKPLGSAAGLSGWIALNLGHSVWFFGIVLALYLLNLHRLNHRLDHVPESLEVVELDQLSDVWINLFIGIGVIWTAVGMRSALQAALGEPAVAASSADAVLRNLVDGGILLALTTTIVGAVGGYLMRLAKTLLVGARLQAVYDEQQGQRLTALLNAAERIEARLEHQGASSHAS
ncbi:MAG: hypothetical protein AAF648_01480 [Pseudomonadota bacterium]